MFRCLARMVFGISVLLIVVAPAAAQADVQPQPGGSRLLFINADGLGVVMPDRQPHRAPFSFRTATVQLAVLLLTAQTRASQTATAESAPAASDARTTSQPLSLTGPQADALSWPCFRGDNRHSGLSPAALPEKLKVRWRLALKEGFNSSPAVAAGVVYVGNDDGVLRALSISDGAPRWTYTARGPIESSPTVADGAVYFGDDDGLFHAVSAADGKPLWTFQTGTQIIASAVVVGPRVLCGSYDGSLYCLTRDRGELAWKYTIEDKIHATPAIAGGLALLSGCDGNLHAVRLADGQAERIMPLGSASGSSAALFEELAIAGTYGNQVVAVNWRSGSVSWTYEHPDRQFPFLSSPALAPREDGPPSLIIGGRDKLLRALDASAGKTRWEFPTRGRIDSSPVICGSRVYIGSNDGNLYVVDAITGKEIWRFEAGGAISATPAIADGCLIVGTADGVLYCLSG